MEHARAVAASQECGNSGKSVTIVRRIVRVLSPREVKVTGSRMSMHIMSLWKTIRTAGN